LNNLEIKKYDWVDSLRGYAILLVIMIHTSQMFLDSTFHLNGITRIGDLGVTMFFIVSSFTLFNSYKNRETVDGDFASKFFFIRRFFRIAPLYYLATIFYVLIGVFYRSAWFLTPVDPIKVLANITFMNGIYLPGISYIPPGGWSVGVEMLFYLTIPFLFSKIKTTRKASFFVVYAIICSFLIQISAYYIVTNFTHYSWLALRSWELYFWLPNQFPVFCFGIFLFFIIKSDKVKYKEWMLLLSLLLIAGLNFIHYQLTFPWFLIQREYLYSIAFTLFAFSVAKTKFSFIIRPVNRLGKVSFSMYLIHFIVIEIVWKLFRIVFKDGVNSDLNFIILYVLVVFCTYFMSKITYRFIEKAGISTAESLIEKIKKKDELKKQISGKLL